MNDALEVLLREYAVWPEVWKRTGYPLLRMANEEGTADASTLLRPDQVLPFWKEERDRSDSEDDGACCSVLATYAGC